MEFVKETSPHVKRKDNLNWMLLDVIIALAPVLICAFVYYPLDALRTVSLSVVTMELCEFLFVIITKKSWKEFKLYNFLSALISALIFSLMMPSNPGWESGMGYWIVIASAAIGIILGKLLFGGFGQNIFNPAALGMVIARLGWSGLMANNTPNFASDVMAGATPLEFGKTFSNIANANLFDLFMGRYPAALGEALGFAILIGLIYLLIRRTIDWRVVVGYAGAFIALALVAGIIVNVKLPNVSFLKFTAYQIFSGGFLFCCVFMITDPVTGPTTSPARFIFGAFGAIVAIFIRFFAAAPEGVAYGILFANMIAPVLDYPQWASQKWKKWHWITLGSLMGVALLVVILVFSLKEGFVA